jgi:hypothetical protein
MADGTTDGASKACTPAAQSREHIQCSFVSAGGATIVTLEALNLEADASTASHSFASRRASPRFEINLVPAECVQSRKPLARADTDALLIMMVVWRAGGIFTHFAEKDVLDGAITVANLQLLPGSKMGALP